MINKLPVYQQLNIALRNLLNEDRYSPGDKFLTERAICEQYGVSRSTANKALSSLVSEKLLEFKKGVGTFVAGKQREMIYHAAFPGEELKVQVIDCVPVEHNGSCYEVIRLSRSGSQPVILEYILIPEQCCPGLPGQALDGSITDLLEKSWGIHLFPGKEEIEAVVLKPGEAVHLGLESGTAVLCIKTVYRNEEAIPVIESRKLMRPGFFRLSSVPERPSPQQTEF